MPTQRSTGLTSAKLEREQRMQIVDVERLPGERRAHTIRRMYAEMVALAHAQVEDETRGNMLSRVGRAAGSTPLRCGWVRPRACPKYASDELKQWWDDHGGRITATEFAAQFTGDRAAAERIRATGQERDFGV